MKHEESNTCKLLLEYNKKLPVDEAGHWLHPAFMSPSINMTMRAQACVCVCQDDVV